MSNNQAGTKRDHYRSRAEADGLAAEYEASGLSREEFCSQRNVALKSLERYVARYRKQKAESDPEQGNPQQRWVAVEVAGNSGSGGELAVLLSSGRRIEVRRGFDASTLRQLLAVLERA